MNLICLNTAFKTSDIALIYKGEKVLKQVDSSLKQSENVLVCIDDTLSEKNADINEMDCVATVVGPGSFTGIRIGIALTKGFYVAKPSLKLVEIVSLDLMAYIYFKNFKPQNSFWCILNALSGNIFACKYNLRGEKEIEYKMYLLSEFNNDGLKSVGLKDDGLDNLDCIIEFTPNMLLNFAISKINNNKYVKTLNPIYLRLSQAEVELESRDENKKN